MKKHIKKMRIVVALVLLVAIGFYFQNSVQRADAYYQGKETWDWYRCNLVFCSGFHHAIFFTGYGDDTLGVVYAGEFTGFNRHYPVTFKYNKTWTVQTANAGYAYGNYTIEQSVIASSSFSLFNLRSKSLTKSVSFIKK